MTQLNIYTNQFQSLFKTKHHNSSKSTKNRNSPALQKQSRIVPDQIHSSLLITGTSYARSIHQLELQLHQSLTNYQFTSQGFDHIIKHAQIPQMVSINIQHNFNNISTQFHQHLKPPSNDIFNKQQAKIPIINTSKREASIHN